MSRCCGLTTKFPYLQEMPPSDPVEHGHEGDWDTVGEPVEASRSPAPTVDELLAQLSGQPLLLRRVLRRPLLSLRRQRLLRRKRKRLPRLDWSTLPASSAPNRDGSPVELVSGDPSRVVHYTW
jgi:hypothetical protein